MEAKAGKTMNLSRNYQKLISAAVTLLGVVCIPKCFYPQGKGWISAIVFFQSFFGG